MKLTILTFLQVALAFVAHSQSTNGILSNDIFYSSSNPAYQPQDTNLFWHLNVFSFDAVAASSTAKLSIRDVFNLSNNAIRSKYFGNDHFSNGWINATSRGPELLYRLNKRSTISFSSRLRGIANFRDLDSRLLGEIGEDQKKTHSYPYALDPNKNSNFSASVFSEIGFSYAHQLLSSSKNKIVVGVGLRYVSGISHTSFNTSDLSGNVRLNKIETTSYLTGSFGKIDTKTSGNLFDSFTLGNLIEGGIGSISGDLGLIYSYTEAHEKSSKFSFGIALKDLGSIKYKPDTLYSKSYDVHISDSDGLFFNTNFNNSSFSQTSKVFDRYPKFFSQTSRIDRPYKIGLPTSAVIAADYHLADKFHASASSIISLRKKSSMNALSYRNYYGLVPRFEGEKASISVPLGYQDFAGFTAGFGIHWKQFFISSRSLFTSLFDSKQLDLNFGLAFYGFDINNMNRRIVSSSRESLNIVQEPEIMRLSTARLSEQIKLRTEIIIGTTTGNQVPYWLRVNKFGSIPLNGPSVSAIAAMHKDYDSTKLKTKLIDWGMGLEGRYNAGKNTESILNQAFIKGRLSIFQLKAGRSKDVTGLLADTTLSLGAFAISGNALGIPKIEASIPTFYTIPIFDSLFAFKGNISHGWIGTIRLGQSPYWPTENTSIYTFFHQKSLYAKFGKPKWKAKFYGGFNHNVFWSDVRAIYGSKVTQPILETFWYAVSGKRFGKGLGIEVSKIGNHLGSIDLGLEYDFGNLKGAIIRQNFYDVGALSKLANIRDGLNGISIENKGNNHRGFQWKKILFEYFHSVDQAGQLWSKLTASGDEDYYNNYTYPQGWSYRGLALGSPIITTKTTARRGLRSLENQFFLNNRVSAFHLAIVATARKWEVLCKLTYSNNFGTYATSPIGSSLARNRYVSPPPYFQKVSQFSGFVEISRTLKNKISVNLALSGDSGKLLYNSLGGYLKVAKSWN